MHAKLGLQIDQSSYELRRLQRGWTLAKIGDSGSVVARYTVVLDLEGSGQCSCEAFQFAKSPRKDCKHLEALWYFGLLDIGTADKP